MMMSLESSPDRAPVSALTSDPGGIREPAPAMAGHPATLGELARRVPAIAATAPLVAVPLSAGYWYGLRSLPVIDECGLPVGILRRDELTAWVRQNDGWVTVERPSRVHELSRPPRAIWRAEEPWRLMLGRFREGLPSAGDECLVVDEEGRYVGIVTTIDLLRRAATIA